MNLGSRKRFEIFFMVAKQEVVRLVSGHQYIKWPLSAYNKVAKWRNLARFCWKLYDMYFATIPPYKLAEASI